MKRYSTIDRISDPHIIKLKDFTIFKDCYITEYDKILIDDNTNIEYHVLEYEKFKENVLVNKDCMPYFDGWRMVNKTALKFDKQPPLNAKLYIKPNQI